MGKNQQNKPNNPNNHNNNLPHHNTTNGDIMAYCEEGYSEGMARDRKQRKKANRVLTQYFQDHKGRAVEQAYLYNQLVSSYDEDKNHTCHWAFYEWIEKQVKKGKIKREPITRTRVVGYNLTYIGDKK